jgi:hypothetical protein
MSGAPFNKVGIIRSNKTTNHKLTLFPAKMTDLVCRLNLRDVTPAAGKHLNVNGPDTVAVPFIGAIGCRSTVIIFAMLFCERTLRPGAGSSA